MSVAVVRSASNYRNDFGDTVDVTISVLSGDAASRYMHVAVSKADKADSVASVTWDPTGQSESASIVGTAKQHPTADLRAEIWELVAPAEVTDGTLRVVVNSAPDTLAVGVVLLTGVDQSTPSSGYDSADGSSSADATVDITSETDDMVLDVVMADVESTSVGGDQTERWAEEDNESAGAGSSEPGAGTATMSWTLNRTGSWIVVGVNVEQSSGNGAPAGKVRIYAS